MKRQQVQAPQRAPITTYQTEIYAPAPRRRQTSPLFWLAFLALFVAAVLAGLIGGFATYLYANGMVLPGVHSMGVPLTGLSAEDAATSLRNAWSAKTITLESGDRQWSLAPEQLGMSLDAEATAAAARDKGRTAGGLRAMFLDPAYLQVPPVWRFDPAVAQSALVGLAPELAVAPVDATIAIVDGRAVANPAVEGQGLDVNATLDALSADPVAVLTDGRLPLVVRPVPSAVQDVSAAVDEANRMLATTVMLRAYDPVRDQVVSWTVEPATWNNWLRLSVDPNADEPYRWSLDPAAAESYLTAQGEQLLGDGRYLEPEPTIAALSDAIRNQTPVVNARVYHPPSQHTVQSGETLSSIGRAYGIPYPWIQQANPGVESLVEGQTVVIPSPDVMLPLEPVEGKRIIVSIAEQNVRVFENGQVKWEWPASTGIASSPTAPGIFQVQSHEPNAYAGNWDLWMPSFMGIYRPVPTSDFMNGFHGFPTRGDAQLLWTGDLGHEVTYGCILLSSENAETLYNWAEEGVVVEVTE